MELAREEMRDFEMQHACAACGGALAVRVTPGIAHAVCRSCRSFSVLRLVTDANGVALVHRAPAVA